MGFKRQAEKTSIKPFLALILKKVNQKQKQPEREERLVASAQLHAHEKNLKVACGHLRQLSR
jgi:hypothetical protein